MVIMNSRGEAEPRCKVVGFATFDVSTDEGWDRAHRQCEAWDRDRREVIALDLNRVRIVFFADEAHDEEAVA